MNRGLLTKAFREQAFFTLLVALGMGLATTVLAYVLPRFQNEFADRMAQFPVFRNIIRAMVGTDVSGGLTVDLLLSIPWVHPVVMALLWTHAIVSATRVPAGEVDRGTIDILLGLPVSRWQVLICETVVAGAGAVLIVACALAGHRLGSSAIVPDKVVALERLLPVAFNMLAVYGAVACGAFLVSSFCDRRGSAAGVAVALVLASFLLNYLAQFWDPAKSVAFLGVLNYYRPVNIVRAGLWPWRDVAVLVAAAAAMWGAGGVVFSRRDLCTV